jgi:hypothetical protein
MGKPTMKPESTRTIIAIRLKETLSIGTGLYDLIKIAEEKAKPGILPVKSIELSQGGYWITTYGNPSLVFLPLERAAWAEGKD